MEKSEINIASKSIQDIAGFKVQVQQNGYKGGDGGHGGFVKILLQPNDQTYCELNLVDDRGNSKNYERPQFIELTVRGDSEREVLILSLEFIIGELKKYEKKYDTYTVKSIKYARKYVYQKITFHSYIVVLEELSFLEFRMAKPFFPPDSPFDDKVFPLSVGDKINCELDWEKMKLLEVSQISEQTQMI